MNKKSRAAICLIIAILLCNISICVKADITAKSAVVMDMESGRILYSKNADEHLAFASTTKIMTAILSIEMCDMDQVVKIDDRAIGIEGSSIHLEKGEELKVIDLLYGLMLHSGNDAAVALAIYISGDVDNFASLMNYKAKMIGANNTNFANPNGLPDSRHYTTASDLALISQYAMNNEIFRQIVSARSVTIKSTGQTVRVRNLVNKNKLLYSYEGANGIKTGYTDLAGRCFCGAAEKNGMQLISVVLNSHDTYGDTKKLFDYYFDNYSYFTFFEKGEYILSIPVTESRTSAYKVYAPHDIIAPLSEDEVGAAEIKYDFLSSLKAPMKKGEKIGQIQIIFKDNSNISIDITLQKDIKYKNTVFDYILDYFKE